MVKRTERQVGKPPPGIIPTRQREITSFDAANALNVETGQLIILAVPVSQRGGVEASVSSAPRAFKVTRETKDVPEIPGDSSTFFRITVPPGANPGTEVPISFNDGKKVITQRLKVTPKVVRLEVLPDQTEIATQQARPGQPFEIKVPSDFSRAKLETIAKAFSNVEIKQLTPVGGGTAMAVITGIISETAKPAKTPAQITATVSGKAYTFKFKIVK